MKKWIRWQGLIVFILVLAAGLAFISLYADLLLKDLIEKKGSEAVGAKVELSGVNLSLFPFGISLSRLQVTNPDQPMKNAVEIDRMVFSVDWSKLFFHKVIIDEMSLQGVRVDTDRRTSGAIIAREAAAKAAHKGSDEKKSPSPSEFDFSSLGDLPDINEILEKEELESLKLARSIEYDINTIKNRWLTKLSSEIPDQRKIKDYEKRIKKLKKLGKGNLLAMLGNVVSNADELASLYNDLNRDFKRIKSARKDFKKDYKWLRKRIKQVEKVPQEDINRLREKYRISPGGLSNVSGMLFGKDIEEKVEAALTWYEKMKPYLDGSSSKIHPEKEETSQKPEKRTGKNFRFQETEVLPDFLVRQIDVSGLQTGLGVMGGNIQDLTPDQAVLGKPLTFAFEVKALKEIKSARLTGVFDHVVPAGAQDTVTFQAREYLLKDLVLSGHSPQTISLKKGMADLDLKLSLTREKLVGEIKADLNSVEFSVGGDKEKDKILSSILDGISKFNLRAEITGTLKSYRIELKSDLDRILKDALASLVKDQLARLEKDLNSEIMKKVRGPLAELNRKLVDFQGLEAELAKRSQKIGTIK